MKKMLKSELDNSVISTKDYIREYIALHSFQYQAYDTNINVMDVNDVVELLNYILSSTHD